MSEIYKDFYYNAVYEIAHEIFDSYTWTEIEIDDYNNFDGDEARMLLFELVDKAIDASFGTLEDEIADAVFIFENEFKKMLEEKEE